MNALLLAASLLLPPAPQPAPPFPKILTDAPVFTDVAPDIRYGDYSIVTQDGPLAVHVIAVDLHDPLVRVGTALAENHLVSSGETVSSMAHRTGAVAGVNGDYFDIDQTNQPLNILLQNGRLMRMPMHRWALAFDQQQVPSFAEFSISAQAVLPGGVLPLKTINDWGPPGGGAVLITPEYGALHPAENVTEFTLELAGGDPPFAAYRVTGIADNTRREEPGYYLAIGPQAYGTVPLPNTGDTITVQGTADPPLDNVRTAIGGGPLLVKDGAWYPDPDGPNTGEFLTHMPATAAGVTRDGTLLLFQIDGRQPALSIGMLQPQIASLMIAFGVVTGMQFDGGGSSTMVARLPGDMSAAVQNSPSDGVERRVGDALLLYSDAPYGPASKLYATPQSIRALPGARVALHIAVTDTGEHTIRVCGCSLHFQVVPGNAGTLAGGTFVAGKRVQDAVVRVTSGSLQTLVPVHVTTEVARAELLPLHPVLQPNQQAHLQVRAFDAKGYPIALPDRLAWTAADASIDDAGVVTVRERDANVEVRVGDRLLRETIVVGEHAEPLTLRETAFSTAPRGAPGGIDAAQPCPECTTLRYDFTGNERAAYIDTSAALPERTIALASDVFGDGHGEVLRVALNNSFGERFLYTLATINWHGWRRVSIVIPAELQRPVTLKALYLVDKVGPMQAVTAAGAVSIRNLEVVVPGRAPNTPVQ